ncbi:MAG: hypothetical protein Kow00108_26600 [Calditrichia bacterium]
MKNKPVIIYSGYNNRAVVAWLRYFSAHQIPYFIIARDKEDYIHLTSYKDAVVKTRTRKELLVDELIEVKRHICAKHPQFQNADFLILPSSEFLNRFFLARRQEINREKMDIPLVDLALYENISDKYAFGEICKREGIPLPEEFKPADVKHFPVVIKPKSYFGKDNRVNMKPAIIEHKAMLDQFFSEHHPSEFYIQQFVGGRSYYLLMYMKKNGEYVCYSQENLIQQYDGRSITGAVSSDIHHSEITDLFARLLRKQGFHGLIMIEVKVDRDQFYMIEANPRIWGPSQLILDANMQLMDYFALENGLLEEVSIPSPYKSGVRYFWSGGIIEDLHAGHPIAFHQYTKEQFFNDYHLWMAKDIYLKEDTIRIYQKEAGVANET